jgi:trk system potassium uptake protein TrkA
MADSVIIVGAGKVGIHLARLLLGEGRDVKVLEVEEGRRAELDRALPGAKLVLGSGTDPDALEAAGARQASVVAAVTGADEVNLVVSSLARFEFGVPRTVARVNDPAHTWMFSPEMGVDVRVSQADILGFLIAEEISVGSMMTLMKLHKGDYSLVEERVHPAARAAGKAVRDLNLPAECVLAAVLRAGELIVPQGSTVLLPEDEVLAVVHGSAAPSLAALLGPPAEPPG